MNLNEAKRTFRYSEFYITSRKLQKVRENHVINVLEIILHLLSLNTGLPNKLNFKTYLYSTFGVICHYFGT